MMSADALFLPKRKYCCYCCMNCIVYACAYAGAHVFVRVCACTRVYACVLNIIYITVRSTPIRLGCFEDTAVRDLTGLMTQSDENSFDHCAEFCASNGK